MRLLLLAPLLAGLFVAHHSAAQYAGNGGTTHDCRLARYAIDQPFYGLRARQRRYVWHIEYFALANLVALAAHRVGLSDRPAAVAAQLITADVPHAIGLARHRYPFDAMDVLVADPVIRSAPFFWTPDSASWRDRLVALGGFAALYAAVACYASP